MRNENIFIKKIIILLIVTIIPLIAATLIGVYSYNRYQDEFEFQYMKTIEEDTETRLHAYLKYFTDSYEKDPYYQTDVLKDGERVLTYAVYRGLISLETQTENEEVELEQVLQYYFVIYNINYTKLVEIEDPTGEKRLMYNSIPALFLSVNDNDSDKKENFMVGVPRVDMLIWDYDSSPEKDVRGNELNSRYLRFATIEPKTEFSNNVTIELYMTDDINDENASFKSMITSFTATDFEKDYENIDTSHFEEGYQESIFEAGYFGYAFSRYIWWQSLIAFVLVGFITFSFYVVWVAEVTQKKVIRK